MATTTHLPQIEATSPSGSVPAFGVSFEEDLHRRGFAPLRATRVTTLQVNVGKLCNQACHHCHVEAGPKRTERMEADTAARIIELMRRSDAIDTVDITGGAPELNPNFRRLVAAARDGGRAVIDRCNLTVLLEPGQEDLADFLTANRVRVVASLPCYSRENVDKQRGRGVFGKSIDALVALNQRGFGQPGSGLELDLVYNPVGPFLPPAQKSLEKDYKRRLEEDFGVVFNQLYTITNMPIRRFAHQLARDGAWDRYIQLLVESFNPSTVNGLMCRSQISIGYDGKLFDCDFNQMLELEINPGTRPHAPTVWEIDSLDQLDFRAIVTAGHCFGCTAGAGSSCGGALDG